jgi:hypothetical protein
MPHIGYENRQFGRIEDAAHSETDTKGRKNKGTTRKFYEYLTLRAQIVNATKSPSFESLMKILSKPNQISADEIQRKNPTMSQALAENAGLHPKKMKTLVSKRWTRSNFSQDLWRNS